MTYEKFLQTPETKDAIESKFLIWQDLIKDADVSEETKQEFIEALLKIKNWPESYSNLEDAIYGIVGYLINVYKKDPNQAEAKALFENIRDDLWPLVRG